METSDHDYLMELEMEAENLRWSMGELVYERDSYISATNHLLYHLCNVVKDRDKLYDIVIRCLYKTSHTEMDFNNYENSDELVLGRCGLLKKIAQDSWHNLCEGEWYGQTKRGED